MRAGSKLSTKQGEKNVLALYQTVHVQRFPLICASSRWIADNKAKRSSAKNPWLASQAAGAQKSHRTEERRW